MNQAEKWKILLVDDERHSREAMADWLESEGFECVAVSDGQEAIEHLHDGIAVIVTDLKMPRTDGLQLLQLAKEQAPHAAVIMVSGYGTVDTAVTALKEGAFDFLAKPIDAEELTQRIKMALEKRNMATEIARLHAELNERRGFENIIGNSPAMRAVFEKVRLVADTRSTVLIVGESGTGKELVARAVHQQSSRRQGPFVPINCAAIPETLVESELFGYEKGAFTGATARKRGLFQSAEGGTLFIDEVGELPLGLQAKLLRALENRKVLPVGGSQEVDVDVRLVAATNRDLSEQVEQKQFREDLFYRLKVVELEMPPLRNRPDDIPLLIRHFIDQIAEENGRPIRDIEMDALVALQDYDWPGNVRELRNLLESIIVLSLKEQIELSDLPEQIGKVKSARAAIQPGMTMAEIEKEAIRRTLEQTGGRRGETAELLGISVRTLQRKIKEYGLPT